MKYEDHFEKNPDIQGGPPVIKGTEVTLHSVMKRLAQGAKLAEILEEFPELTERDVRAVIAFAAIAID